MLKYFFIVGTPRSGTTLLQAMLMQGHGVYIPPETNFLETLVRNRRYIGDLRSENGWRRAIAEVDAAIIKNQLLSQKSAFERAISKAPRTYRGLFQALLDAIALEVGASWIGEKSPAHTKHLKLLIELFPESRIIHIIRDPRDVAVSQRESWGTTALQAALRWRRDVRSHYWGEAMIGASRYASVHYESLVREPESSLVRLCAFLGLPFESQMLTPHLRARSGFADRESHKKRTLQPITTSRIGRFRQELSRGDQALVELLCDKHMGLLGYDSGNTKNVTGIAKAAWQLPPLAFLHLRRYTNRWKRLFLSRLRSVWSS